MKEVNAVELRQSVGNVARILESTGEPVLLKVGRRPVGVIVSLRDFRERFALADAAGARRALVEEILGERVADAPPLDAILDEVRGR